MKKNDIVKLNITDIVDDGKGIGRVDDMVVFCRGMLPGESGDVLIIKVTKSYAVGKLLKLDISSNERIDPPTCDNFTKGCGGCTFCHLKYSGQLEQKQKHVGDCLKRIGGFYNIESLMKPIIPSQVIYKYRNKSIYPFASDSVGNVVCGFYAQASHRVIPITDECGCNLENEMSAKIREFTVKFANAMKLSVYDESNGSGLLRSLMVRTNFHAEAEAMVVLVVNCELNEISHTGKLQWVKNYASGLVGELPFVVSVYICSNTKNTNVVLSSDMRLIYGKDTICDVIGDFYGAPRFEISPLSFYQVNPAQTKKLYDAVYNVLPKNLSLIYDIYCGIGTIGLYLMSRLRESGVSPLPVLVGIEAVPSAVEDAQKNAVSNGLAPYSNFFYGDASDVTPKVIERFGRPSVIILDPPRKGCDTSLIETVLKTEADCVIYVSCDPATLARDLKILCSEKYVCKSVQPVDMFPHSGHVETVVCLEMK